MDYSFSLWYQRSVAQVVSVTHTSWWVPGQHSAFRTHFAILCVEYLLFREREKRRKKSSGPLWQLAAKMPRLLEVVL
jgi:hypothetical protein